MATDTRPIRTTERMQDANGHGVILAVDCAWVIIRRGGKEILLGPEEREAFMRLYFDAVWAAEKWAKEHAGRSPNDSRPGLR
jgi:hypothetical protein